MSILFTSQNIGSLEIGNRFVRSAAGESGASGGTLSRGVIDYYEKLAAGGIGLIISGHAYVRYEGRCHDAMTGASDDHHISGLKNMSERVHETKSEVFTGSSCDSSRIALQINHKGMDLPERINELSTVEIQEIIRSFADAAMRAKLAGFDAVQVHAAHGYLLSQFLYPKYNRRTDEWKGAGLVTAVLKAVREKVGAEFPVFVKFNCDGLEPESLTIDESVEIACILAEAGAEAVEVSGATAIKPNILKPEQEAYFAAYVSRIREAVGVPVILVGGLRSMIKMEEIVENETADFVSMCRPFIREPDLVAKFHSASPPDLPKAACISCNRCWSSPETGNRCGILEKNPNSENA